ncbi:MAG TPA: aminodeoxychorismate synthase component I [Cyclobacteriaceae bacterium]|nr:aminodeoxychorismate synthase component I [Cyclobacteriaceae bacterium]
MNISEFTRTINEWGRNNVPFLFVVDFEMKKPFVFRLDDVNPGEILFDINGFTNAPAQQRHFIDNDIISLTNPTTWLQYKRRFETVLRHLEYGDTYLANLTIESGIQLKYSLCDIFYRSRARYKLWYRDEFLVFSPEIFVQIKDGKIYSYPMKGTIDAAIPRAREIILMDKKELAEHVTIVDLIRNDLSLVANQVKVNRFRYVDELRTNYKTLLQISSEITGDLAPDYHGHLGEILVSLLPAGSVSGAPKSKTLEVIREAETNERGYYTGVFGYFDGNNFDSGVMIRFIEKCGEGYIYKSGGGITTQSNAEAEYQEAIDKIYVPLN